MTNALARRNAYKGILSVLVAAACVVGCLSIYDEATCTSSVEATADSSPRPEIAQAAQAFIDSIGVNAHLNYYDRTYGNFALVKNDLSAIGIRHIRDGVHLQSDDYNNLLYGRWIELGKMGVRFDAVLDPRSHLGPLTPALLKHVEQLSGNFIESFEGPNELDIASMPNWPDVDREYQQSIFSSVQSLDGPGRVQVIGPSLAFVRNGRAFHGAIGGFDEANLHSYPGGKMPSAIYPEQMDLAKQVFGAKPIVMTESGYHNALRDFTDQPGISEQVAAKYIPRLFLENFSHGIVRTYLYEFFDEAPNPDLDDNQLHWGLVRADGTAKPAFQAVKNLIDELNSSGAPAPPLALSWSLSESSPAIHHVLLKKANGEFDLVLWQEVPSYNTWMRHDVDNPPVHTTLVLGQQARHVVLFEPALEAAPIATYQKVSKVPVAIPDHPLVVEIGPE